MLAYDRKNNVVSIEGILSEVSVKEGEFTQSGTNKKMPYLSAKIKVQLTQDINGVPTEMEIPIESFAAKYTKEGKPNPMYAQVDSLRNDYISLASAETPAQADRINIYTATLKENVFLSKSGKVVSIPVISASFFNKVGRNSGYNPSATFQAKVCIGNIREEVDEDGDPTGALVVQCIIPQYGGKVDVVDCKVTSRDAIEHIQANWSKGDTVNIGGKLNFSSKVIQEEDNLGFGESMVKPRTVSTQELIITTGSATAFEGDLAFDTEEIAAALNDRRQRIDAIKQGAETVTKAKKSGLDDIDF